MSSNNISKNNKKEFAKMWGGRFSKKSSSVMEEINSSIFTDYKLASYDIKGSIAHAKMLGKCNIISHEEAQDIVNGLEIIKKEFQNNEIELRPELEDIHTHIEVRLKQLIGDVAGKLHTARSRNDQVVLDFKLWTKEALNSIKLELISLEKTIVSIAEKNIDTYMPGFTHLQPAQPITFAHHILAYFEMFKRDINRVDEALSRIDESPLGAGALAGTSFPIDRDYTAKLLNFSKPTENSIDSVSDRDFSLDFLYINATISTHLSRLGEELVIWSTPQFNFITMDDAYSTGSSIMPQKKNPDAAELIRGKAAKLISNLNSLFINLKGLPLAYSKDLQEDKAICFDSFDNIILCLKATNGMLSTMGINKESMYKAAACGYTTATEIADWLVQNTGIPFREAHEITGNIVKLAEDLNINLENLSLEQLQSMNKSINSSIYDVLSVENAVNRKNSYGGTAMSSTIEAIKKIKKQLNLL